MAKPAGGTWIAGLNLRSPLGRRLLTMLALATLAPIATLALLADHNVNRTLRDSRAAELTQHAKSYGMGVLDRLLHLELDLASAAEIGAFERLTTTRLAAHGPQHGLGLLGFARLTATGGMAEQVGSVPGVEEAANRLSAGQRAQLAAGRIALLLPQRPGEAALLLKQGQQSDTRKQFVVAAVAADYLWSAVDLNPLMTHFCVATEGRPPHCQPTVAGRDPVATPAGGEATGYTWSIDGEAQQVATWTLFVESRLAGPDLQIFALQPASYVAAPTTAFRAAFLPVAVASLLTVLLLAAYQVRLITEPIDELLQGTRRLAQRNFASPVAVRRNDELGHLATAFNTMAARVARQIGTLQTMTRIDRAILNSVDLSEVAVNSIRCLRHIVDTDLISVGLIQPATPTRLMVQTRRRGGRGIETLSIDWSHPPTAADMANVKLPAAYSAHLQPHAEQRCRVLPISRNGSFWGVVVLGDGASQAIDPDRAAMLSSVVDRLAVALSTAARDWRLHMQAHYDPLTGLANRVQLIALLAQQVAQARRDKQRGAVLFVDLDRFKQINDTLGHAAGDTLLRLAAERIKLSLRDADTVARIGGDEFAVVLPRIGGSADAGQVASNLINALARPFEIEGQKLYAGGSVGIALFPDDGVTAEELLKRSDTAMYRAKELGRGRYAYFKESMGAEVNARAVLDRELRQALERNELVLHYQPQIDLRTGKVNCAEALLRWQHPTRGLLGPGEFIDFAEESGLIESIGTWVLMTACAQHRRWEDAGITLPRVAVNVSNRQLKQPAFLATVDMALVKANRAPWQLEVEITESMAVDSGESALRGLQGLQRAGVMIAIDDFGTGYSSFSYLRSMPATVLKLDRAFVIDIATDPDAAVITASMIHMARTLRKTVVVEGVETEEQLALLTRQGADGVQGYLISRPLPVPQFEEFMRQHVPQPRLRESLALVKPEPLAANAA